MNEVKIRQIALLVGPLLALLIAIILYHFNWSNEAVWAGALSCLCAVWWIFEPIPIPVTSLVPLTMFPAVGVLSHQQVAQAYGHKLILLLLGGFILSTAVEKCDAHKKLASVMINLIGTTSKKKVVLAFMITASFLSMWISNTATTLMLLPIVLAVITKNQDRSLDLPLLLGVAYAASIGGLGTPIGTPPNVIFMGVINC